MSCTPYLSCDNKKESWESLFKRLIVEQDDGSLAIRTCCPEPEPPPVDLALELTWDDIANVPVADASSVSDWNTFFDLPTNGTPFTSVTVAGNVVYLYGGSGITIKADLFDAAYGINLISFNDLAGSIIEVGTGAFNNGISGVGCPNLIYVNLPSCLILNDVAFYGCPTVTTFLAPIVTYIGDYMFDMAKFTDIDFSNATYIGEECFLDCWFLTNINIQNCSNLGGTTSDNAVFHWITGQTIAVTCPAALLTCNGGAPDGDLCYLHDNNTITVNGAPLVGCP